MPKAKKLLTIVYIVVIVLLVALISATYMSVRRGPFGLRVFYVQSSSMEPALPIGSLIFTLPQDEYEKDDIITFYNPVAETAEQNTITHRIVEVGEENRVTVYTTQGDANDAPDMHTTPKNQVIGKQVFKLPFLGYIVNISKQPFGFVFLIALPAYLIILGELKTIREEISKMLAARKVKKQEEQDEKPQADNESNKKKTNNNAANTNKKTGISAAKKSNKKTTPTPKSSTSSKGKNAKKV